MSLRALLSKSISTLALITLALIVLTPAGTGAQPEPKEPLPTGARIETVLREMRQPVAMVFDPAGRLFYTERTGAVRRFANGQLQPNPVISFGVSTNSERGLLGIALDPDFNNNRLVYVFYSCGPAQECPEQQQRVVRFVENNGVGSNPSLLFTSPDDNGCANHDGGNIHFGPDGKLYITLGDDGCTPSNSQDLSVKQGKIHRINPDGSIPQDNPFPQAPVRSIYAIGLRNSFDFTFDPIVRGRIFASENGPGCDDEMNRIEAGFNYGWRPGYPCDDANPDPRFNNIRPLWFLSSSNCCLAPTGITVYTGQQIPQWRNHLFMANYNGGVLYHYTLNADRTLAAETRIVEGVVASMDILTGPDGALYYLEGGGYQNGTLKRIVGPGQPAATPTPGPAPTIPGSGSRVFPETGNPVRGIFLEYWDRNGGLAQQGFPISELMTEISDLNGRSYTVQYFERAVFEHHPENQSPFNVLLSQLGTFQYRKKYPNGAPNQRPNTQPGSIVFPETGKRVGGRFLEYWREYGGLAQQGFPISEEFQEKSDLNGQTYIVQYFERAVFEYHPENRPPFDVLLSQLGTFRYREKYNGR